MRDQQTGSGSAAYRPVMRTFINAIGVVACLLGIWMAGGAGLARLLSKYGMLVNSLASTTEAVRFSSSDPEAHYAHAVVLSDMGQLDAAITEFARAVALRPGDYVLWLEFGRARDQNNDEQGALKAFREAVRLAPYYARPRWQLGNLLLRMGRPDEAFAELRRAVESDPTLLPAAIDLIWGASDGDATAVRQTIQPQTSSARLTLAHFFLKHGGFVEALELFRLVGDVPAQERRAFLTELLAANRFTEAYEVWSSGSDNQRSEGRNNSRAVINDGGFESKIIMDDPGFGWHISHDMQGVRAFLDTNGPHTGAHSLRLDFNGNSDPSTPVISQLALVEPGTGYRLTFAARTKEMVTGGEPIVIVTDAGDAGRVLAQSPPLPQGTNGWQDYTLEFATSSEMSAILIAVERRKCARTPCPAIGSTWLDDFSLRGLP